MEQQYDPQKAHEYYEKHKQLKGRTKKATTDTTTKTTKKTKTSAKNAAKKKDMEALKGKYNGKIT